MINARYSPDFLNDPRHDSPSRRYESRRDLTRSLKLTARADLALRSPPSKPLVLENLLMQLCEEARLVLLCLPTLFGFACVRLQGGPNNLAPDGAGFTWLTMSCLTMLEMLELLSSS